MMMILVDVYDIPMIDWEAYGNLEDSLVYSVPYCHGWSLVQYYFYPVSNIRIRKYVFLSLAVAWG